MNSPAVLRRISTAASFSIQPDGARSIQSTVERHQSVTFSRHILSPDNPVLRDAIAGRDALIICTPSVDRLYGRQIREYLSAMPRGPRSEVVVASFTEATKSVQAAVEVCELAAAAGIRRASPIVGIGGGVCTDIVGLGAALHHRGVPHIKVPTTLIGIVDAGIGTKNAVNLGNRKSGLGTFHPPEHSLLDPTFLASLPARHIRNGLAEIVKVAVILSGRLFGLLAADGRRLIESRFSSSDPIAAEAIRISVDQMLSQLSGNLFEVGEYRRLMDFGHSFSPYTEAASGYRILHGEAVAMDIALSTEIATTLGLVTEDTADRVFSLLADLGLALAWPQTSVEDLWSSLRAVAEHRNGDLNLVVPTGIGSARFLGFEDVDFSLLSHAHDRLSLRADARTLSSRNA